jgi:hypothetical protein
MHTEFLLGNLKVINNSEELNVERRIIQKEIYKKSETKNVLAWIHVA